MSGRIDLVIVGMGSGGMVGAEFAATIGLKVAVVERARIGGDCLWTGCVPSKTLIASAKVAHQMRHAERYGLPACNDPIDTAAVWDRIRRVQQQVATTDDSPERFEAMGIELITGTARVIGPNTVRILGAGPDERDPDRDIETRCILICTGSRPVVPDAEGLVEAGFLTSETLWDLPAAPSSMIMIGAGPIATEMAQALCRLGVATTVLERGDRLLRRDEPDLVAILAAKLRREGVDLRFGAIVDRVVAKPESKVVHGSESGVPARWEAEEILLAAGRRPNVEGLGLDEVGVTVNRSGIEVDDRMRTSVPSIYAAGDVAGRFAFTHSAGYEAVRAIRDAFYPGRGKVTDFVPWCTFTDPELAHAGLTVAEAEERHGEVEVWRLDLAHSDRARADDTTEGAIMVVTAKGRLVGAHILASAAGEMIHELALAINQGLKLAEVASLIHVYPTLSTGIGQLAGEAAFEGARKLRWLVRKER